MDKNLFLTYDQLTADQQKAVRKAAYLTLHARSARTQFPILCVESEYFMLEKAMIEAGLLRSGKSGVAHTAFLQLIDEMGLDFPCGQPSLNDLSRGSRYILCHNYPWQASHERYELMMPRWRAAYLTFMHNLPEELRP